jgi:hypothetical protein
VLLSLSLLFSVRRGRLPDFDAEAQGIGLAGTGSTGWGYVGETSSQRLRAHTSGFAAAMSAAFGVITNIAVPYLINEDAANLGLKTAWVC